MRRLYPLAPNEPVDAELTHIRRKLRAMPTGEYRRPRKGEWFLSGTRGAEEACLAKSEGIEQEYHIAVIV